MVWNYEAWERGRAALLEMLSDALRCDQAGIAGKLACNLSANELGGASSALRILSGELDKIASELPR